MGHFLEKLKVHIPLSVIILVATYMFIHLWTDKSPEERGNEITKVKETYSTILPGTADDDVEEEIARMKDLFDLRIGDYKTSIERLVSNQQFILIFFVLGLLVLFYRPGSIRVPIIGIDIPDTLVYLFLIFGTLFIWSSFNLLMMSVIDSRMVLEHLADAIEDADGGVAYYYSSARVLLDQGFVDSWCTHYFDIFKGGMDYDYNKHHDNARYFLFGFYVPMIGCCAATALAISNRLAQEKGTWMSYALMIFQVVSLIAITFAIYDRFPYAHQFYALIWLVILLSLILWLLFGSKLADKIVSARQSQPSTDSPE